MRFTARSECKLLVHYMGWTQVDQSGRKYLLVIYGTPLDLNLLLEGTAMYNSNWKKDEHGKGCYSYIIVYVENLLLIHNNTEKN